MNANGILVGLLTGAAIGVGLGILFAPEKGEVTRQKIKDTAKKTAEDLEANFDDKVKVMKGKVDELIVELEKRLEELRKHVQTTETAGE